MTLVRQPNHVFRCVWYLVLVSLALPQQLAQASSPLSISISASSSDSSSSSSSPASSAPPQPQHRPWFQICPIRQRQQQQQGGLWKSKLDLWKSQCKRQRDKRLCYDTRLRLLFTKPQRQGTVLSLWPRHPTKERVSTWFWGTSPISFNHAFVGVTHPCLQVAVPVKKDEDVPLVDSDKKEETLGNEPTKTRIKHRQDGSSSVAVQSSTAFGDLRNSNKEDAGVIRMVSRRTQTSTARRKEEEEDSAENAWWPQGPFASILNRHSSRWRVLRFRRRVGYGQDCYERVKEAALNADFGNTSRGRASQKGIISVLPPPSDQSPFHRFSLPSGSERDNDDQEEGEARRRIQRHEDSMWSQLLSRHIDDQYQSSEKNAVSIWPGGGRRLATFTRALGGLVWAVSPVSVVYELVDQPPPPGSTKAKDCQCFTSTAFATCQGHWLCGEERVTVALRQDMSVDVELLSLSRPGNSLWGKTVWPLIGRMQHSFFLQQLQYLEKKGEQ